MPLGGLGGCILCKGRGLSGGIQYLEEGIFPAYTTYSIWAEA